MKLCRDGRVWGQNDKEAGSHLGILTQKQRGMDKGWNIGKDNPMFGRHRCGKDSPMFGRHHSEATKQKISEGNQGKRLSEETKRKLSEMNLGEHHPQWKGGVIEAKGYILIHQPEHPRANCGYVKQAALALEEKLGRPMLVGTVPHHINGIKDDDRPENLQEMLRGDHQSLHNKQMDMVERANRRQRTPDGRFC